MGESGAGVWILPMKRADGTAWVTTDEAVAEVLAVVTADPAAFFSTDLEEARAETARFWSERASTAPARSAVGQSLLAVVGELEAKGTVRGQVDRSRLPWSPSAG